MVKNPCRATEEETLDIPQKKKPYGPQVKGPMSLVALHPWHCWRGSATGGS
jgi:hypothetical protein